MSLQERLQLAVWRTRELRKLLEDEDKINLIVRCSDKFQRLQRAVEKILVSNQKLAKASLCLKPKIRDTKLLLAVKYKELEKLRNIIQIKQEQLAEKYSINYTEWCLLRKINHAEEEFELLFQSFARGKMPLGDFLDSFLSSRMLHHIRVVMLKKLQEMIRNEQRTTERLSDALPGAQCFSEGFPEQILPVCSQTAAVVLPSCCHPPFLLPLNATQCLQHSPFCSDEFLHVGAHRRGLRWPTRPIRLQPLTFQQWRNQQAPQ